MPRHTEEEVYAGPIEDKKLRPAQWGVRLASYICRPLCWILTRYEIKGREKIPKVGEAPVILAANHVSFMDPVVLWCTAYPRITRFLTRRSLFRPVVGPFIARAGGIAISPDTADRTAIKNAAAALKRGELVGIFPEGTRMNTPEKVYKPHAGLVLIANMGKAKIVPVGIAGTDKIMPYGSHFIRLPKVHVAVGDPIDPADYADVPKHERTQAILDDTMKRIFELRDEAACER